MGEVMNLGFVALKVTVQALLDHIDTSTTTQVSLYIKSLLRTDMYTAVSLQILNEIVEYYPKRLSSDLLVLLAPPHIRKLCLKGCTTVSMNALHDTFLKCKNIELLDLSECNQIMRPLVFKLIGNMVPTFSVVILENCNTLIDESVRIILRSQKHLKHLNVSQCENLTDNAFLLHEDMKHFSPSKSMGYENSFHRELVSVNISGCQQLTSLSIKYITLICGPTLRQINMSFTHVDSTALWYLSGYSMNPSVHESGHQLIFESVLGLNVLPSRFKGQSTENTESGFVEGSADEASESQSANVPIGAQSASVTESQSADIFAEPGYREYVAAPSACVLNDAFGNQNVAETANVPNGGSDDKFSIPNNENSAFQNSSIFVDSEQGACAPENHAGNGPESTNAPNGGAQGSIVFNSDSDKSELREPQGACSLNKLQKPDDEQINEEIKQEIHEEIDIEIDEQISKQIGEQISKQLDEQISKHFDEQIRLQIQEQIDKQIDEQIDREWQEYCDQQFKEQMITNISNSIIHEIINKSIENMGAQPESVNGAENCVLPDKSCDNVKHDSAFSNCEISDSVTLTEVRCDTNPAFVSQISRQNENEERLNENCNRHENGGVSSQQMKEISQTPSVEYSNKEFVFKVDFEKNLSVKYTEGENPNSTGKTDESNISGSTDENSSSGDEVAPPPYALCQNWVLDEPSDNNALRINISNSQAGASNGAKNIPANILQQKVSKNTLKSDNYIEFPNDTIELKPEPKFNTQTEPAIDLVQYYKPNIENIEMCEIAFHSRDVVMTCLKAFFLCNTKVEKFSMSWSEMNDDVLDFIATITTNLKQVSLIDCDEITTDGLSNFCTVCHHLTSLNLQGVCFISDAALTPVIHRGDIHMLNLAESNITNKTLESLAEHCTGLKQLDISWCDELTPEQEEPLKSVIENCTCLEKLYLRHIPLSRNNLQAIGIYLQNLQYLNLSSVSNMMDPHLITVSVRLVNLLELDVSWNSALTDIGVSSVMRNCTRMKRLILAGIKQMTSSPFLPLISGIQKWRRCQALFKLKYEERKIREENGEDQYSSDEEFEELYLPHRSTQYSPKLTWLDLEYCDQINDGTMGEIVAVCRGTLTIRDYYGEEIEPSWIRYDKSKPIVK